MSYSECIAKLRSRSVGRIAVSAEPFPVVFPVNYVMVSDDDAGDVPGHAWVAIRTRPGNTIDEAGLFVGFEIDEIDESGVQGWSVLVRGTMHVVDEDAAEMRTRFDPGPALAADRERWLRIQPTHVSGRELLPGSEAWAFSDAGYL